MADTGVVPKPTLDDLLSRAGAKSLTACIPCPLRGSDVFGRPCPEHYATEHADVMFVAKDPGAGGPQNTGVLCAYHNAPFDDTAAYKKTLLDEAGVDAKRIYSTNACMHGAPGNQGPPGAAFRACAEVLRRQIEVVDPRLIVTHGKEALKSTYLALGVERHVGALYELIGQPEDEPHPPTDVGGRLVFPMYHLGRRNQINASRRKCIERDWGYLVREGLLPRRRDGQVD